eukprot:TRINITY_DN2989_c0_g1_i1.p1 TRINITY_DN2989_c0_g1~~TRINITY_DN2989_c0_g1_i1.p1  ORF type:complete len:214 (+),score=46.41 TRINITY_DN2989_c0_g1_i1:140-781(+)
MGNTEMESLGGIETTGTTIVAVVYDKGVLIAADTRTTSGNFVHDRSTDKLDYLHDKIYVLRSGGAADTQSLAKIVRHYIAAHSIEIGRLPQVKTAARLFQQFMYRYKQLLASIMVAGWDPYDGPQVYSVQIGGTIYQEKFHIGGSGSSFIYGYVDSNYKENMSFEECRKFVVNAVSLAMARDGSSGGMVRLVNITQDAVTRDVVRFDDLPFTK